MIVTDYIDEAFVIRQQRAFVAAGGVLGSVANPANIVFFPNQPMRCFFTSLRLSTDVVSACQLFRITANPALAAGATPQCRDGSTATSNVLHQFAIAASPATTGLYGAFRSGPTHVELIGKFGWIGGQSGQGIMIQFPALALNISYTMTWFEFPLA